MIKSLLIIGVLLLSFNTLYAPTVKFLFYKTPEIVEDNYKVNGPKELFVRMWAAKIPFAKDFSRVAVLETGWGFENAYNNNIFGFKCNSKTKYMSGCWNEHAVFKSHYHAVMFMKEWIDYSPPAYNETFEHYITRRGYNPYSWYLERLSQINF